MSCKFYRKTIVSQPVQYKGRQALSASKTQRPYCLHADTKFAEDYVVKVLMAKLKCAGRKEGCVVNGGEGYEEL